jgi:hypothetical protein
MDAFIIYMKIVHILWYRLQDQRLLNDEAKSLQTHKEYI